MARMLRFAALGCLLLAVVGSGGCSWIPTPPVADFDWEPSDPLARSDVEFNDLSSDTGFLSAGGVVAWTWDFGDSPIRRLYRTQDTSTGKAACTR